MLADPDDLNARVHAIRLALLCDPSPLAPVLADVLLSASVAALTADPPNYGRLRVLAAHVADCETALGLLVLAG